MTPSPGRRSAPIMEVKSGFASALRWLREQPFRAHWALVLLMAFLIPALTARTEKPGEFYPFSNFPMYSRFEPQTYYVYVTDLRDQPVAVGPAFGIAISNVKKAYDRKLDALKKASGVKGMKKADLPAGKKREAGGEVLRWLRDNAPDKATVDAVGGLRLHQVNVTWREGRVRKEQSLVGEIALPPS